MSQNSPEACISTMAIYISKSYCVVENFNFEDAVGVKRMSPVQFV